MRVESAVDWRDELRARGREWREQRRQLRNQRRQDVRSNGEEKWEKTEKHEHILLGPLIGGLALIVFGAFLYLIAGGYISQILVAMFFFVGVIIIAAATYGTIMARRRHPRP